MGRPVETSVVIERVCLTGSHSLDHRNSHCCNKAANLRTATEQVDRNQRAKADLVVGGISLRKLPSSLKVCNRTLVQDVGMGVRQVVVALWWVGQ